MTKRFWIGQKVTHHNRNATIAYIHYKDGQCILTIKSAGWDPPLDVPAHQVTPRRSATYAKYRHTNRRRRQRQSNQ